MSADPFVCPRCGWQGSHRECIWVYRLGPGNSSFECPECYPAGDWRADSEKYWPPMPDPYRTGLDGIDRFLDECGPPTGNE